MRTFEQRTGKRRQRGAVAIILGITLAVLIGFAGLAIDLGRFFVIKSELQNAMDACALAAASQLRPGQNDPNALNRAVAYGRVFSTGGVDNAATGGSGDIAAIKNRANFQDTVIDIAVNQITFSDSLNGDYQPAGSANANTAAFAKCGFPLTNLPIFFMRVLSPSLQTQTVSAMAAATLAPSSSSCLIPVAVCKKNNGTNFGITVGEWMPAHSKYGTGNFGWIDFDPPGQKDLKASLAGSGQCSAQIGDKVGTQGVNATTFSYWNARFGLYRSGGPTLAEAAPDFTGYSYADAKWNPLSGSAQLPRTNGAVGSSVFADYKLRAASFDHFQGTPPNPYAKDPSAVDLQVNGRIKRLAVAPVVDCDAWASGNGSAQPSIEGYACVLMLNPVFDQNKEKAVLEFLGLSTQTGSPCATNGEPGTFGPLVPQLVQ